jgi:hypothetical protein
VQVGVDIAQDVIVALAGIGQHLADLEGWEALAQGLEAWDGLQMVVAIGCDKGSTQRPVGEQAVVERIEGLAFVTEVVLARPALALRRAVGGGGAVRLVAAAVVDIDCLWIAGVASRQWSWQASVSQAQPSLPSARAAHRRSAGGRKQSGFI